MCIRDRPIILTETACAYYRSGRGPFYSSQVEFTADAMGWWAGGQLGFVHVAPKWFVDKPLTFVSTWDGDELSMIRAHHQLRAARKVNIATQCARLDEVFAQIPDSGGFGYYRTLPGGEERARSLMAQGFRPRVFPNGTLGLSIPLDLDDDALSRLIEALAGV